MSEFSKQGPNLCKNKDGRSDQEGWMQGKKIPLSAELWGSNGALLSGEKKNIHHMDMDPLTGLSWIAIVSAHQ